MIFGENFIHWIKVSLNKQQSCIIDGGFPTRHFNLEKGACQDDNIRSKPVNHDNTYNNKLRIIIFNHTFVY